MCFYSKIIKIIFIIWFINEFDLFFNNLWFLHSLYFFLFIKNLILELSFIFIWSKLKDFSRVLPSNIRESNEIRIFDNFLKTFEIKLFDLILTYIEIPSLKRNIPIFELFWIFFLIVLFLLKLNSSFVNKLYKFNFCFFIIIFKGDCWLIKKKIKNIY